MDIGKLYDCKEYYLLLFPDRETATDAAAPIATATRSAAYWSRKFEKPVSYYNPETPLLVLSTEEKYVEVLVGDKRGWIVNEDWLEIKEIS